MKSKVRQIAVTTSQNEDVVYALCEDGTVWFRSMVATHMGWVEVPTGESEQEDGK